MSPSFLLHTCYRSSCSGRLRIALNLKQVQYECTFVNLWTGQSHTAEHLALNPNGTVPVLTDLRSKSSGDDFPIAQSVAALEYLEETLPRSPALLPSGTLQRAQVRVLVNVICDTQPVANRRVAKVFDEYGHSGDQWMKDQMTKGLATYEKMVSKTAGVYSVGDTVTLADVCLIPQVWNAENFGVDLEKMPIIMRIFTSMSELDVVKQAHWRAQPDTPKEQAW